MFTSKIIHYSYLYFYSIQSCIEFSNFEKLCKNELLEMYKRVAMPLPQRQRGNAKDIDMDIAAEKSITDIR